MNIPVLAGLMGMSKFNGGFNMAAMSNFGTNSIPMNKSNNDDKYIELKPTEKAEASSKVDKSEKAGESEKTKTQEPDKNERTADRMAKDYGIVVDPETKSPSFEIKGEKLSTEEYYKDGLKYTVTRYLEDGKHVEVTKGPTGESKRTYSADPDDPKVGDTYETVSISHSMNGRYAMIDSVTTTAAENQYGDIEWHTTMEKQLFGELHYREGQFYSNLDPDDKETIRDIKFAMAFIDNMPGAMYAVGIC